MSWGTLHPTAALSAVRRSSSLSGSISEHCDGTALGAADPRHLGKFINLNFT